MQYTILRTNDNQTATVELVFDEHNNYTVNADVPLGNSQDDLNTNILAQAETINDELNINLAAQTAPYNVTLDQPQTINLGN